MSPAVPRRCPHCAGAFLPAVGGPLVSVQCPHCAAVILPASCEALPELAVPVPVQVVPPAASEEAAAAAREEARSRRSFVLALAATGVTAAGAAIAWTIQRGRPHPAADSRAGLAAERIAAAREIEALEALVRHVLSAPDWRAMLPHVADADRVRPDMEWFHARAPEPLLADTVESFDQWQRDPSDDREAFTVRVTTARRGVQWVTLVQQNGAWKFDWEAWANPGLPRWHFFCREPAGSQVSLRLFALRMPAAASWILKAGGHPEHHRAFEFWAGDRADRAAAMIPANSPLLAALEGADFENAVRLIARVTMVQPALDPPLVTLDAIMQRGWIWGHPESPREGPR